MAKPPMKSNPFAKKGAPAPAKGAKGKAPPFAKKGAKPKGKAKPVWDGAV
jgi:hypothetical protein